MSHRGSHSPRVAVIGMGVVGGHFNRSRPIIAEFVAAGADVHVFGSPAHDAEVTRLGASFVDLFACGTLADLGDTAAPVPVQYVTWAGRHAEDTLAAVRDVDPQLIVCDDFAVVGRVVASALDVPIAVTRGAHLPQRNGRSVNHEQDPRVRISEMAEAAAQHLAHTYGLRNMSPLSFVVPFELGLNLLGEPKEFVNETEGALYPEAVNFGSVLPSDAERRAGRSDLFPGTGARRLYLAFGTYIWRDWSEQALAVMHAASDAIAAMPGWSALISLGGAPVDGSVIAGLERPNVRVQQTVDQWAALAQADLFITHHGLNSTHEAIYQQVPMISFPFFADQPIRARKCQDFGLAVPLTVGQVDARAVRAAIDAVDADRPRMEARLAAAREWQEAAIAARPGIVRDLLNRSRKVSAR